MTRRTRDDGLLRTADVVRESGYSPQQVRDLERLGVLPPAVREPNGYRAYTAVHVRALRAYRALASAAGPVEARRLLRNVFAARGLPPPSPGQNPTPPGPAIPRSAIPRSAAPRPAAPRPASRTPASRTPASPDPARPSPPDLHPAPPRLADAAAAIGAVHVRLARERDEVLHALAALDVVQREPDVSARGDDDVLTITQLAAALGVRTSTLRFWEQEGLAVPRRVTTLRARQYGADAVREARIVAALRAGGYGIPAVRDVVGSLRGRQGLAEAREILDRRLDQIAVRTIALLRAGADLAATIEEAT